MKEYPKGAIRSINELIALKGQAVYEGSKEFRSISSPHYLTGGLIAEYREYNNTYYYGYEFRFKGAQEPSTMSLRDVNVIENTYNDWFLFTNREDAEAYAKP